MQYRSSRSDEFGTSLVTLRGGSRCFRAEFNFCAKWLELTWSLLIKLAPRFGSPRSETMGIAITLQQYLTDQSIPYDCVEHRRTGCAAQSAEASHVSSDRMAKAVVLKRRDGYILAVLPSSRQVMLDEVGGWLRQPVGLATEEEVASLFPDCAPGAVPPIAAPYGLRSVVDESLEGHRDIYFEAGDHRTLVHLSGEQFHRLMAKVPHGRFSTKIDTEPDDYAYSGA